ncbi:hypothetical protein ACIOD2_27325 [Amycolatopsis sp. NPDC088138]|uniref:hypothetical protein n=1 Tax=Amycolatopsis sp. NPDC088138 TaxID=3363938 RepID=UPI003806B3D7
MSEQEYHPSAQFNPAHPDNAGWANGPKPPQLPAEAQIVRDFTDPDQAPPAEAGIVQAYKEGAFAEEHVAIPTAEDEPKAEQTPAKAEPDDNTQDKPTRKR